MRSSSTNFIITQILFIKGIAIVYLFAFASWYLQIASLYGRDGLVPINIWMKRIAAQGITPGHLPSILWWSQDINAFIVKFVPALQEHDAHETVLHLLCLAGILISLLLLSQRQYLSHVAMLGYLILYLLYLSLYHVGQNFASFQWDIMLLEAGFLAIFFTPKQIIKEGRKKFVIDNLSAVTRELVRWLAFRLYYASGVLKLASQCPTWWNLSALNYHFESQCLPHLLSWYFHQIPVLYKRFMVAANFFTLIGGSLLFFAPIRSFRIIGALLNILMQLLIIASGNYNFFNILSIFITCVVFDDETLCQFMPNIFARLLSIPIKPKAIEKIETQKPNEVFKGKQFFLLFITAALTSMLAFFRFFPIESIKTGKLIFDNQDVQKYLVKGSLCYFVLIASILFCLHSLIFNVHHSEKQKTIKNFIFRTGKRSLAIYFALFMYAITTQSFLTGLGNNLEALPNASRNLIQSVSEKTRPFTIANSYGLFRRMTGIAGREELVIEGSHDSRDWKAYELFYKPANNLTEIPAFAMPHQPRLDWQLWFSAMAPQVQDAYLISLLYKLYLNSEIVNKQLIRVNPFKDKAPIFLRVKKYYYHFTNFEERNATGNYWKRDLGRMFFGPLQKENKEISHFIRQMTLPSAKDIPINPLTRVPIVLIITTYFIIKFFWL